MSGEHNYYDKRIFLVNLPYYTVGNLLSILGYEIHPPVDYKGVKIPGNSPVPDRDRYKREKFLEILTDKLIELIEQNRVVVKNELELIIESPVRREELNRARMYKSEIVVFCSSFGVRIVFKEPAELFIKKVVGDKEMLDVVHSDINLISDEKDIHKERLSEPGSPQSSSEEEQDIQIKQTVQEILADYKELAKAFKVEPHNEDKNLKWFLRRCSDVNDYPAFKDARVVAGRRGGSPAKFRVLAIAAHLLDRKIVTGRSLRTSIEKHFGDILPEFDDLICPPPS